MKTIEEKARAYDEALSRAKKEWSNNLDNAYKNYRERLEIIFPELAESEDEKIRKALVELVKCNERSGYTLLNNVSTSSMLVWLEKQAERKLAWDEEDEENMNNILYILNQLKDTSSYEEDDIVERIINWIKSLKDRLCSSNEYDKDMLGAIAYCIKNNRPLEKEHIAWLENQSKQNLTWSEDDEKLTSKLLTI